MGSNESVCWQSGVVHATENFLGFALNSKVNAEIAINRTDFGILINDKEMCWCEIYDTFFYKLPSNIGHEKFSES